MHQNKLFNQTRRRLAGWYAGVMGVILSLSGLATYEMVVNYHWQAVNRELESVSGTLHDNLESKLRQPGIIEPSVEAALPGLCLTSRSCASQPKSFGRHILGIVQQNGYYLHFLTQSGQMVALLGQQPDGIPIAAQEGLKTVQDAEGTRYQQLSLLLKSTTGKPWGYMQIGRSLKEYDDHLATLRLLLLVGLPLAMLTVAIAAWWLAGLSMQPIYQSYRQVQQFTADAAHELRTPLATLKATIESAHDAQPLSEAEVQETLTVLDRQNTRLVQLVQDLLLLSRMESSTETLREQKALTGKQQQCCLNDLVSDLVEELSILKLAASITLLTDIRVNDIRVNQPLYVNGNETQLSRAIANLATNALQYTPAGGKVTVILDREDHYAQIRIQDTGIGIAPEDQTRIFDRFYRVNSDRSRHTGGSGLGLAIAKAIIQAHRGSIRVESEVGRGSTFTIRLPLLMHY